MCDHTYCYTPSVRHIRSVIEQGDLGDILFVDSVRINLGLVQSDVNVLWDLAPHDLSILDYVLPAEQPSTAVAAHRRPTRSVPVRNASATCRSASATAARHTCTSTGSARPRSAR